MRAALLVEVGEPLVIEDLEPEPLGEHDVRVRVDASGVCHSDLSIATGLVPMPPPVILGHEGAKTIALEAVNDAFAAMTAGEVIRSVIVPSAPAGPDRTEHVAGRAEPTMAQHPSNHAPPE